MGSSRKDKATQQSFKPEWAAPGLCWSGWRKLIRWGAPTAVSGKSIA